MTTDALDKLLARFAGMAGQWSETTPIETMRGDLDHFFSVYPTVPGTRIAAVDAGTVPAEHISAPGTAPDRWILVLHGGGFSTGSARAHRAFASHLSASAGAQVLTIDYRLAPEHPWPAAFDDALHAFEWLLARGIAPERIAVSGDSAGGGLAACLLLHLRDKGCPLPGCATLLSPWADLACDGGSYVGNAAIDPIASKVMAVGMAATYLGPDGDPRSSAVSAVNAKDLAGLPPIYIQSGSREIFLDDAHTLKRRIDEAGGDARLEIVEGMIHQFQLHVGQLPESGAAIDRLGAFIRTHSGA